MCYRVFNLIEQWQQRYARLENKEPLRPTYQKYYQVKQYCQKYLERLDSDQGFELQVLRDQHHRWGDQFAKANFLATSQVPEVVEQAYVSLNELAKDFEGVTVELEKD